jgi:hypothetical protein
MAGVKRRQEEERGMMLNPDKFIVEGAEGFAGTPDRRSAGSTFTTNALA